MTETIIVNYRLQEEKQTTQKSTMPIENQINHPHQEIVTHNHAGQKTTNGGLRKGWTRATFILREEYVEKLKAIAYWERTTIKEIMDNALSTYFENQKKQILNK